MANRNVVLITGASGWLGSLLARSLLEDVDTPNLHLILADLKEPSAPKGSRAVTLQADLTDQTQINALFETAYAAPDTVYCLHGIMSRGSEDNFDLGMKVNFDSVKMVLEAARQYGQNIGKLMKFIFTSGGAVYGGPLPDVVTQNTIATPEGAYGTAKLAIELFVNEYTRRGFVDGRVLRLPSVVVRWGSPTGATSAFLSSIVLEPLKGVKTTCPIGDSFDSPELDLETWVASPLTTIKNLIHAKHVPAEKFLRHTRVVNSPGFTTTIKQELAALEKVAGKEVLKYVAFKDDETNRRLVKSWPREFDNSYALSLGFTVDEGGMVPIVERLKRDMDAGLV